MKVSQSLDFRLYRLGWNCRLHQSLPLYQQMLLRTLYMYRQGYAAASLWAASTR